MANGRSFEGLLVQLRDAHELELHALQTENDALKAQVERLLCDGLKRPLWKPGLQDAFHTAIEALGDARDAEPLPKALEWSRGLNGHGDGSTAAQPEEHPQPLAREPRPPQPLPCPEPADWDPCGVEGGGESARTSELCSTELAASDDWPRSGKPSLIWWLSNSKSGLKGYSDIEPKSINFHELCLARYPERQWEELASHQKVELLRLALRPSHYLINPRSTCMKYWDILLGLALAFVGLVTPYEVVFLDGVDWTFFIVNRVVDSIFALDIVLQFFLKVEIQQPHRGGSIMLRDPVALRIRYLKSWFFLDLVSIFPFDILSLLLANSSQVLQRAKILRCVKLMRLAKLLRMLRTSRILQRWQNVIALQFSTQKLIRFCAVLMLTSHWMACVWGLSGLTFGAELCDDEGRLIELGKAGVDLGQVSWVTALYIGGKTSPDSPCNHFEVYTASLHWAVMTITSIGYGDIVPVRLEEYIVSVLCMLSGGVLWAYIIGGLCSIMSSGSPVEKRFEANTDLLNLAMDEARVPRNERSKYREFLREAKAYDRRISFGEVAGRLSPQLRKQLMYHVTKEALKSVYYFNDPDAPPSFPLDVAGSLVPRFFARGESLDGLRHCLCLMDRGTVAHGGQVLVPPSVFHEDFIITRKKFHKVRNTVSLTYTQVLVLTREDMEAILEPQSKFERKIRIVAAKMAFCRAVRMIAIFLAKQDRSVPAAARMRIPLHQAFDRVCGEGFPSARRRSR